MHACVCMCECVCTRVHVHACVCQAEEQGPRNGASAEGRSGPAGLCEGLHPGDEELQPGIFTAGGPAPTLSLCGLSSGQGTGQRTDSPWALGCCLPMLWPSLRRLQAAPAAREERLTPGVPSLAEGLHMLSDVPFAPWNTAPEVCVCYHALR